VTDGYIKLTLLLVTIFFVILYLRNVLLVYSNKWRTESGSHIELALSRALSTTAHATVNFISKLSISSR